MTKVTTTQTVEERLREKPVSPETQAFLIEQFRPFLFRMAIDILRHCPSATVYGDIDDWCQEAAKWLLHAAKHFDPDRGCKFLTLATIAVRRGLKRHADAHCTIVRVPALWVKQHRDVSRFRGQPFHREEALSLEGRELPPDEALMALEPDPHAEALHGHINKLPMRHRLVIEHHLAGLSHEEIARILKVTKSRIGQIYQVAIRKLGYYYGLQSAS